MQGGHPLSSAVPFVHCEWVENGPHWVVCIFLRNFFFAARETAVNTVCGERRNHAMFFFSFFDCLAIQSQFGDSSECMARCYCLCIWGRIHLDNKYKLFAVQFSSLPVKLYPPLPFCLLRTIGQAIKCIETNGTSHQLAFLTNFANKLPQKCSAFLAVKFVADVNGPFQQAVRMTRVLCFSFSRTDGNNVCEL